MRIIKWTLLLLVVGFLALVFFGPHPDQRAAEHSVRQQLRDPSSATFDNMTVSRQTNGGPGFVVCGTVNAKNAFGAMAGSQRFIYVSADGKTGSSIIESTNARERAQFNAQWVSCNR